MTINANGSTNLAMALVPPVPTRQTPTIVSERGPVLPLTPSGDYYLNPPIPTYDPTQYSERYRRAGQPFGGTTGYLSNTSSAEPGPVSPLAYRPVILGGGQGYNTGFSSGRPGYVELRRE